MTEAEVMSEQTRRRPNGENWTIDQFRDALEAAEGQLKQLAEFVKRNDGPSIKRQGSFVQVVGIAPVFTETTTVSVKPRTCNRHEDCDAADAKAKSLGRETDHCHDDCCEDCFGS